MTGFNAAAELTAHGAGAHAGDTAVITGYLALPAGRGRLRLRADYRFPAIARILAQLLIGQDLISAGRVGTETPPDLQTKMPFVRIGRVGGSSDLVNDYPITDVEVFAATSVEAEQLSEFIRQYLVFTDLPAVDGYGLLDRVECITGAQELDWADNRVRRYGATYRITARRRRIT